METDAEEKLEHGEATRDAFQMANVFLSGDSAGADYGDQVSRFLDLLWLPDSHPRIFTWIARN
jgi:hypothetical protein